jgi:hypothetical protein
VNITSGVGAPAVVATRELIGRLFTTNPLLPTESNIEFTTLQQVGAYFGTSSVEYLRAAFYFGFISKNITSPDKISFARWANANTAPEIFGAPLTATLSQFQAISTGAFSITLGSVTNVISGLNFTSATSLADVASTIQTAIRAETGIQWTAATVTYDATRSSFDFVGGDTSVPAIVTVQAPGTGVDISNLIGWITGAIWSNGVQTETITQTLTNSADSSNNFGSFLFIPNLDQSQIVEAATWNDGQNVLYQYMVPVTLSTYAAISAAILTFGGCAMTLLNALAPGEYPEMLPMAILAATDYSQPNSVVNYMFQTAALTPSVSDDATANALDAARVNYYGVTQDAGQNISFYQRGFLTGGNTDPLDMNTYANEQWLKDAIGASLMTLLLILGRISANNQGRAQVMANIISIILIALSNGTISISKPLTNAQQLYITQITGDPKAWYQVQSSGYWLNATLVSFTGPSNLTEFKIVYTLVYAKDDVVRKIEGIDLLI